MKKETGKKGKSTELQLLELLKKVLPKATDDASLASRIFEAVEQELKSKARAVSFDKFCERCPLPDLEPQSIQDVQRQLVESFGGGDVAVKPHKKDGCLAVEVTLPDGSVFTNLIKVKPESGPADEEPEFKPKYVPFPVCLPGDAELIWYLAKQETLTPEEAAMALTRVEEEFWASKTGQKLIRDRVERSFPEFVARAPGGMLNEAGLKRHYKLPEPIKVLRPLPKSGRAKG